MNTLIFEKISDVSCVYPYICVYTKDGGESPFMEIAVSDDKKLEFTIYQSQGNIKISSLEWMEILSFAQEYFPKALSDEEMFIKHSSSD